VRAWIVPGDGSSADSRASSQVDGPRPGRLLEFIHRLTARTRKEPVMTSRLTLSALVFALLSTAALVGAAQADAAGTVAASTRVVQLERVVITVPRLTAKA
jgi:hypothetical protein